jgi:hypothetical protein
MMLDFSVEFEELDRMANEGDWQKIQVVTSQFMDGFGGVEI